MTDVNEQSTGYDKTFVNSMIESALRIGSLVIVLGWSYMIIAPFLMPVLWGIIIAVAGMPLATMLEKHLRGRGRAVTVLTLIGFFIIIVPTVMFFESLIGPVQALFDTVKSGKLSIPPLPDSIGSLPIIGAKISQFWSLASTNMEAVVEQFHTQILSVATYLLSTAGGTLVSVLMFLVSTLIAAGFMYKAESASDAAKHLAARLVGERGPEFVTLSAATIRSVLQGVVGVALIQTVLISIGLILMDVPAAGVWALVTLVVAIAQIPASIVAIPLIIYVYSYADPTAATIFAVWTMIGAVSDNVLKPMMMGRGLDIPMPVILFGAIGGMISWGIMGLFLGAVVLALMYQLTHVWLAQ